MKKTQILFILIHTLILASCTEYEQYPQATESHTELSTPTQTVFRHPASKAQDTSSYSASGSTVQIAIDEWHPYVMPYSEDKGYIYEMIVAVFDEIGADLEIHIIPWSRVFADLENHTYYASLGWSKTSEREENFIFNRIPILHTHMKFYYYEGNGIEDPSIYQGDLSALKDYKIGGVKQYFYSDSLIEAGLDVDWVSEENLNYMKLKTGRIDLFLNQPIIVNAYLEEHFPEDRDRFKSLDVDYATLYDYLITHKDYPDAAMITADFDKALEKLHRDGTISSLQSKYGIEPFGLE